ncbi:MAG: IS200/IS605 family transposase [Pyrinomonadaceae bacterium]
MPRSYTNLIYHIVFSTKDRRPMITADREERLYEYIGGAIRGLGGIALKINGVEDHVHVLAKLRPDKAVSDILRDLKANSSGWMHDVFPDAKDFSWQNGYGAFTVSESQIDKVATYIAKQKQHHQKESFEHEFIGLLQKNSIEFEMKYLWT